jgi:hypothetical protein
MFFLTFDYYHLTQARTEIVSVLPGPAFGPSQARVDLSTRDRVYIGPYAHLELSHNETWHLEFALHSNARS